MSKVLILDDDAQIIKMTSLILQKSGYQVEAANNGVGALKTLEKGNIDVLLTDILMPEMDGIEVINACRKLEVPIKIIAMSGGRRKISAEFNLKSAEMLGAKAVLAKPFSKEQLLSTVENVMI